MRTLTYALLLAWAAAGADDRAGLRVEAGPKLRSRPAMTLDGGATPGTVALELKVSAQGDVVSAQALGGPPELAEPAVTAVLAWKFEPAETDYVEQVQIHWSGRALPGQGPPRRIRVGGNVQQANLIHKVAPVYPAEAKAAGIEGLVRFEVILSKEGEVASLQLVTGDPQLADAARRAVEQWRYKPTLLNGNAVEVMTVIDVKFELRR